MSLKNFHTNPVQDTTLRRQFIAEHTNQTYPHLNATTDDTLIPYHLSTENLIGLTSLPLSIAGPLSINHQGQHLSSYIPLSTTEGALIASINRGIKAITASDGATIHLINHGITRAPVFKTPSYQTSLDIIDYCQNHSSELQQIINTTSQHTTLLKTHSQILGNRLYLRFHYDTDQAMGMNMATIATQAISDHLQQKFDCQLIALSSNFCNDKKPNAANTILGRGRQVTATVALTSHTISNILKTTPTALAEVYHSKIILGSYLSHALGYNAQVANTAAAIFLATGQDIAHIIEASHAITIVETQDELTHFTLELPNLLLGLKGGGTHLPTQSDALKIINHQHNLDTFAGFVAATILAGEISLLASISEHTLAHSHQTLARKQTN